MYLQNVRCVEASSSGRHGVVISRKIDAAINELIDGLIVNNVTPWYSTLVTDTAPSIDTLRSVSHYFVDLFVFCIFKYDFSVLQKCYKLVTSTIHPSIWYHTLQLFWFRNVLWDSVRSINDRLGCIDQVRFLTAGVVTCLTRHLEHIRLAQTAG